ncbi:MAG: phytanoyl-CoA dioxygenase family protein [Gammaproteobacteria bacterium]|nr:phytanoyl-CoA dioxygenase family protein [Gammaproteobacteria bacterium]
MMNPSLSKLEIDSYRSEGFLIPNWRLPASMLLKMQQALAYLLDKNQHIRPEKLVSAHIAKNNQEGTQGHTAFLELARYEPIVDLVEQLIGPDIILWGCHVFCKPGENGYETPWHQDGHYWPIRPLATTTVWVALEDSKLYNGCLKVIPKSHIPKTLYPHLHEDRQDLALTQKIADDTFDPATEKALELSAGEMSIHDIYMIHGAQANNSGVRRTGVALRYMPGTSVFERDSYTLGGQTGVPINFATRPIWLLRGKDQTGKNDFNIGHDAG